MEENISEISLIQPSVELLAMSFPVKYESKLDTYFPDITSNPLEKIIEVAGRTCYKSNDKITEDSAVNFVDKVVNISHHESIAEHASLTFRITCGRDVMAEITRHRLASFSIQSQRYVNYDKKGLQFIIPSWIDKNCLENTVIPMLGTEIIWDNPKILAIVDWYTINKAIANKYKSLLSYGWKPEQARSILPNDTATEIVMTANAREWMHILKLRTDSSAYSEMQVVANLIKDILNKISPTLFNKQ